MEEAVREHLEADARNILDPQNACTVSQAISLKRIADAIEENNTFWRAIGIHGYIDVRVEQS